MSGYVYTPEQREKIINLEVLGYIESLENCQRCECPLMVHITHKPFSWESDVTIVTFYFECPVCGAHWIERDSD